MPDRALANMFGGLGEFIKLREGFQQNTKDQAKKDALHELGMRTGNLQVQALEDAAGRRPGDYAYTDYQRDTEMTGGVPSEAAIDAMIAKNPALASRRPAMIDSMHRAQRLQTEGDARTKKGDQLTDIQIQSGQNQNTLTQTQIDARAEVKRLQAAGQFQPQKLPAHRDLAVAAGMPGVGGPTYEQEQAAITARDNRTHQQRLSEIDHQVAAQNARDVNNLPYGLKDTRQGATIDAAGAQMGASVAAAMKEIVAAQLKITGNLTVKKGGRATDMFGMPLEGVGGTPAAADEQIKIHQARVRTLAEALRRDASKLINTLVNTQGMEQGQAIAIAKAKINSLLSIVPAMQVQDKNGDWYDVDTRLDVLDQLNLRDKGEYKSRTDPTARIPAIPKETTPTVVATPADTGAGILPGAKRPGQP